jgi:hypothetical protein
MVPAAIRIFWSTVNGAGESGSRCYIFLERNYPQFGSRFTQTTVLHSTGLPGYFLART